jgi:hypothetical protein
VGDVDALGALQAGRTRDIGMVESKQRTPGDLDRFRTRVHGDLEAGVEVVGGKGRARRHARILVGDRLFGGSDGG